MKIFLSVCLILLILIPIVISFYLLYKHLNPMENKDKKGVAKKKNNIS